MNKTLKNTLVNAKNSNGQLIDIDAGAGWHIAGLCTFLLELPMPYLLHRFVGVNSSQIGILFMLFFASLLVIQFEAFRRSNGILRPVALASMLFYGFFLFNMMPK
jgi:hypothetical protein